MTNLTLGLQINSFYDRVKPKDRGPGKGGAKETLMNELDEVI